LQRKLSSRSDRVKAIDFHPTEPWLLAALYNGTVYIWNHENQNLVKTFEITDLPVRAAKFIARKSWLITGSDDMQVRVFNYNTHEKVIAFEAHQDYIRHIAVHQTQPYVLTCSDDMTIKLWDWDKGWRNVMVFEGHTHFIMQVNFNPKDGNTFASACLDRTIKVWSLGSPTPNYTLEGHDKGVNCVDYYYGGDKPYLISGGDDKTIKVWDYQSKTCVQTLEGHTHNVTVASFHPDLPIIISASEDGTVRLWHANTYRLENTLNYGMERVWAVAYLRGTNDVAFGYDEGTIAIKLGREEPAVSMDNTGKIIWAKHSEIQTVNVKTSADENIKDGERIQLATKELGSCEVYPQMLQHSPNGRFVVVCGDGEYIIYTAVAWRNKSFGSALEFVWAMNSTEYAIRESSSKVKIFKNFKEKTEVNIRPTFSAEGIFGGALLGIRSSNFVNFYDWETGVCARRVDVVCRNVYWSESDLVAIVCDDTTYILKFNRVAFQQYIDRHGANSITEEGIEEAVDFVAEINEGVKTGCWVGDSFIYTNSTNRLNYLVGGQTSTLSHFDNTLYLLGYISRDNRIYLTDKDLGVYSYALPLSLIQYQTAVLRGDLALADSILPSVPADQRNRVARFLEGQNLKEQALAVSADPEHRFDLAIQLQKMELAYGLAGELNQEDKWKIVGDKALEMWQFGLAEECLRNAQDLEGLLLLYQAGGNGRGLTELADLAVKAGKNNIAFICYLLRGEMEKCTDLLVSTDRIPEAALLARTFMPSQIEHVVDLWRQDLVKSNKLKIAEAITGPGDHPELFPDLEYALFAEEAFKRRREKGAVPATDYEDMKESLDWDVIGQLKERFPDGLPDGGAQLEPAPSLDGERAPSTRSVRMNVDDRVQPGEEVVGLLTFLRGMFDGAQTHPCHYTFFSRRGRRTVKTSASTPFRIT
ncbi:coatomer WD associated region-domain-containing protein, partial [Fimicolochytrium jonesii]|uniref:coatomer WD associated region-domain-containing protein n=1 Tax=Fimicolochytrium jonesii TaxID=1396493 RepID=UPI0022FF3C16